MVRFPDAERQVEDLVSRAAGFIGFDQKAARSANALEILVNSAEATIADLQTQLRATVEAKEEAEKACAKQTMLSRFRQIRLATDEVSRRFQTEKDSFIESILTKLKSLLSGQCDDGTDEPPIRRFNIIYNHLIKDIADLRIRAGESGENIEIQSDPVLKIVSSDNTQFLATCCQRLSGDSARAAGASEAESRMELLNLIGHKTAECQQYKEALEKVCVRLRRPIGSASTPEELERIAIAGIDAQDGLNAIDVGKLMDGMTPHELPLDPVTQARLAKVDRTLAAVAPFDAIIARLSKLLDRQYSAFLPTSQYFGHFLDALSSLKEHINVLDEESILRPIHSLLVKSVELFEALAISLSAAGFAPDYSENHEAVAALLEAQQREHDSVARLRILLEEREQLLLQETAKLEDLEREYDDFRRKHSSESGK
jgi:hypothetical protein